MSISRVAALVRLRKWATALDEWADEIETPQAVNADGQDVELYPGGVPEYIDVDAIEGVSPAQLRGELALIASEIDALAASIDPNRQDGVE